MSDKEITVLFGAGAEVSYGLPTGDEFIQPLLKNKYNSEIKKLRNERGTGASLLSKKTKKLYKETIKEVYGNEKKYNKLQKLFDVLKENKKIDYNVLEKLYSEEKEDVGDIIFNFALYWYEEIMAVLSDNDKYNFDEKSLIWYYIVIGDTNNENLQAISDQKKEAAKQFFFSYTVFFEALDSKFNTLRLNALSANARRVIFAYYNVFLLMMEKLYGKKEYASLEEVRDELQKEYAIYQHNKKDDYKTYYTITKEYEPMLNIATTNYTELCSIDSGKKSDEIAYLHGNLKWFEDFVNLKVYDITQYAFTDEDKPNLFPFILIPSGVKPIINIRELNQFLKFTKMLEHSTYLIVCGYRFNSDDNHINSLIIDWLEQKTNNKLIIFNYKKSIILEDYKWIEKYTKDNYISEVFIDDNIDISNLNFNDNKYKIYNIILGDDKLGNMTYQKILDKLR